MTAAVARPADGPRLARGTDGRRALCVVLFLGALFALGLLFGSAGGAHATQRIVPEPPDAGPVITAGGGTAAAGTAAATTAGRVTDRAEEAVPTTARRVRDTAPEPLPEAATSTAGAPSTVTATARAETRVPRRPAPHEVARAARDAGDSVQHTAVDTVHASARGTVREITGVLGSVTGTLKSVPVLPHLMPSVPAVPPLPFIPDVLPVQPSVPLAPLQPAPTDPPSAVSSDDGPAPLGCVGHTVTGASDSGSYGSAGGAAATAHGTGPATAQAARQGDGRSPVDPCGGAGRTPAAETNTPRGGDQQAAPAAQGPSFGLVRGTGLPATAAPVRDRSGEILEFPG
ncbi:hypothetical protein [Streptomyces sp. NPDC048560]|uniref:hypothetical protein n=1 Tax=Streptomyces sp. NPDC048560 TaxID=3155488 RepID=UPI0034375784